MSDEENDNESGSGTEVNTIVSSAWETPSEFTKPATRRSQGWQEGYANQINQARTNEKEYLGSEEFTNEPKKFMHTSGIRRAYFLKQYADMLDLYDELDPSAEKSLDALKKNTIVEDSSTRSFKTGMVSVLSMMAFLKYRKINPFIFSSYFEQFYMVLPLGIFSGCLSNYFISVRELDRNYIFSYYSRIYETRNYLHAKSTILNNDLKHPEAEHI
jgi:hypothetical protein